MWDFLTTLSNVTVLMPLIASTFLIRRAIIDYYHGVVFCVEFLRWPQASQPSLQTFSKTIYIWTNRGANETCKICDRMSVCLLPYG